MDVLLWDARFFCANKVAEGCTIPVEHLLAIYAYCYESALYRHVQDALQSRAESHAVAPFIGHLTRALAALPPYDGVCYVMVPATSFDPGECVPQPERCVQFPTFLSATADYSIVRRWVQQGESALFVLQPKTGKLVGPYSAEPRDQEVVFQPGSVWEPVQLLKPHVNEEQNRKYQAYRERLVEQCQEPGYLPTTIVELREV